MSSEVRRVERLRCLFLGGPLGQHAVMGRVATMVAAGFEVYLVNVYRPKWTLKEYPISRAQFVDALEDPFYKEGGSYRKKFTLEYLRSMGVISEDRNLATHLRSIIQMTKPHFAVVHYGSIAIHYARMLKRTAPRLPVIDILNLLPSAISLWDRNRFLKWGKLEKSNYRHWLERLEGVVCASREMLDFAIEEFGVDERRTIILPDYLPASFQGRKEQVAEMSREDGNPHVIFLGAPERWGGAIDMIDEQFKELVKERIHVHSATLSEQIVSTSFGHRYPLFSNETVSSGRLAEFASQFDATLVTYNVNQREERFRSTYPTRFFMALTVGIPIAVREGILDACERFVTEHEIGFVYTDASDLREKLLNRTKIAEYRRNTREKKRTMTAEAQGEAIRRFIRGIEEIGE